MPWEGGNKVWHDRAWVLDRPDRTWREAGTLPRPLAYGVSATWRDSVICVGGSDAERHYAEAFRLLWKEGAIQVLPLAPAPLPLSGACGALVGDVLYIAGGSESPGEKSASARAFALDLAASKPEWGELPPIPGRPRLLSVAAGDDKSFYVFGGAALESDTAGRLGRVYLREGWCFTPGRGWRRLADLPKSIVAAPSPAPVIDGRILLIAGDDGSRTDFKPIDQHPGFPPQILAYDILRDEWSTAADTPAPRATVPVVEWGEGFVIPSGEVRPGKRSPETWLLAPG